jgi:hypothetical protein
VSPRYLRTADVSVSTTDPDATHLRQRDGVRLGYQAHYVVDGGKARIILAALVAPAEVPEDLADIVPGNGVERDGSRPRPGGGAT